MRWPRLVSEVQGLSALIIFIVLQLHWCANPSLHLQYGDHDYQVSGAQDLPDRIQSHPRFYFVSLFLWLVNPLIYIPSMHPLAMWWPQPVPEAQGLSDCAYIHMSFNPTDVHPKHTFAMIRWPVRCTGFDQLLLIMPKLLYSYITWLHRHALLVSTNYGLGHSLPSI